jgi:hypothetical protein
MEYDALPGPVPVVAPETVIHEVLLAADQPHPVAAVTVMEPVAALGPCVRETGEIEYEQVPACEMLNVWPATLIDPDRWPPLLLATE